MSTAAASSEQLSNELAAGRLLDALRDNDSGLLASLLAPDVVLRSPLTDRFQFHGRDRVVELYGVVHAPLRGLERTHLVGSGRQWAQFSVATVLGRQITTCQLIEFNDDGLIERLMILCRPLPGLIAFFAAIAPGVMRRRSRVLALLAGAMTRPLVPAFDANDRIATALLRDAWS